MADNPRSLRYPGSVTPESQYHYHDLVDICHIRATARTAIDRPTVGHAPAMTCQITFCLAPTFPLFGLASAVEVLRHANRFAGRALYDWNLLCEHGDSVHDSNGLALAARRADATAPDPDVVFVVAGYEVDATALPALTQWLRRQGRRGIPLGGISNGAFILAGAGLLDGSAATVHFEDFSAFHDGFPAVRARYQRTVIERARLSCSGGTSTLDLFIEWVRREQGQALASRVSQQMLLQSLSTPAGAEVPTVFDGSHRYSAPVQRALDVLEASHHEPLNVSGLSERVGLNRRELLRLFQRELEMTPGQALRMRRLQRARSLVLHSHLPLINIASAVGFSSQSHMTDHYRKHFGCTPGKDRQGNQGRQPTASANA